MKLRKRLTCRHVKMVVQSLLTSFSLDPLKSFSSNCSSERRSGRCCQRNMYCRSCFLRRKAPLAKEAAERRRRKLVQWYLGRCALRTLLAKASSAALPPPSL